MRFPRRALVPALLPFLIACGQVERLKEKARSSSAQQKARDRVEGVLLGVQKGGAETTLDVQTATCLWYNGKVLLDMATLSRASDLFLVWQNEGNIARRIGAYSVTDASDLEDGAVAVSGTIEGQAFRMKVAPETPISWIEVPGARASRAPVTAPISAPPSAPVADSGTSNGPVSRVANPTPTPTPTPDPDTQGTLRLRCSYLVPGAVVTLRIDDAEVFRREVPARREPPPVDVRLLVTPGLHSLAFSMSASDGTSLADRRVPLTISAGQVRTLAVSQQGSGVSIGLE